jgi:hypothetical protein
MRLAAKVLVITVEIVQAAVLQTVVHVCSRSERTTAALHSPPASLASPESMRLSRSRMRAPLISRLCDKASVGEHRGIQRKTPVSGRVNCDRTVIGQAWNLEEHRGLQTHTG